jgi:Zn-dependent protease
MDKMVLLIFFAVIAIVLYRISAAREMRRMAAMSMEIRTGPTGPGYDYFLTTSSLLALVLSACGMIPLIGFPFAVAGLVLLARSRKTTPFMKPYIIPHWFHTFALGMALTGFLVTGLAVAAVIHSDLPYQLNLMPTPAVESPFTAAIIIAAVPAVVLSVTLHECAHGLVALGMGDDTALRAGRLTMNPLRHIDPLGSVVLPLMLVLLKAGFLFGWARPVPVRADLLRDPHLGTAAVSAAGAGANFLFALAGLGVFTILGAVLVFVAPDAVEHFHNLKREATFHGWALHPIALTAQFLKILILLNLSLGILNLIPLPPLDGARLLEGLWPKTFGPLFRALRPVGCLLLPGVLLTAFCVLVAILKPILFILFDVFLPFFIRLG